MLYFTSTEEAKPYSTFEGLKASAAGVFCNSRAGVVGEIIFSHSLHRFSRFSWLPLGNSSLKDMADRLPFGAGRNSKSPSFSSISPSSHIDVSTTAAESFHEPDSMGSNCLVISNGSSNSCNHMCHARVGQSEAIIRNKNTTDAEPYQGVEWVEQDGPGVYITLVSLPGGAKDLKRVRFSRKRFSEKQEELWWAASRVRVYQQYYVPLVNKACIGIGREGLAH